MSNAFYFAAVLFWHPEELSDLPGGQVAPRQKYTRSWILGLTGKIDSDISLTLPQPPPLPPQKIWQDFRPQSSRLRLASFRNGAYYLKYWFHILSDHLMFLFCSTAGFVYMVC